MKYLSPIKFTLEIALRKEFEGSFIGEAVLDYLGYNLGIQLSRIIIIGYFVGGRVLAAIAFIVQTSRFA